jgi:hypothetical protein
MLLFKSGVQNLEKRQLAAIKGVVCVSMESASVFSMEFYDLAMKCSCSSARPIFFRIIANHHVGILV